MTALDVVATGPLTTVQDRGRFGFSAVGVGRSGAADEVSHDAANRLVGNDPDAATLEVTFGGLTVRARGDLYVAVAGAPGRVTVDGVENARGVGIAVGSGSVLALEPRGLRTYLAVRGGIGVEPVLGSRSYDTLARLGPPPLTVGDTVLVGNRSAEWPAADLDPYRADATERAPELRILPGPRADRFTARSRRALVEQTWTVSTDTDRVGMRLTGDEALVRSRTDELPSEGMVRGAIQVPPDGSPVVFLADHPLTGGYPVIAVVAEADVHRAAQCAPGTVVRFVWR